MIYSVVGWMIEVSFHAVTLGKAVNRGFLNGPLCPVYGCGVIMVLSALNIAGSIFGFETDLEKASSLLLFIVGIVFATLIELIAGFLLDKLFHARWWDYRDRRFNLNGYICLEFSIVWGLAIAFVLRVIQPFFDKVIGIIPVFAGKLMLGVMYLVFIADLIITVMTILKLNKQLEHMKRMENAILKLSDGMTEHITADTLNAMDKLAKGKQKYEERKEKQKQKLSELEERYAHMKKQFMYHKLFGTGMLLNNFAENGHSSYQDIINKIEDKPEQTE
ncbi:MAG: putative ABC transporter permease [Lachnospiraceae bacterium]|nr:putative ABC transporter permease [Lachnospiraceae bacterium]